MNSLRRITPLTEEDLAIWDRINPTIYVHGVSWPAFCLMSDRRDADLMYLARLWRSGQIITDHTYAHNGPCGRFAIDAKRCGGDI